MSTSVEVVETDKEPGITWTPVDQLTYNTIFTAIPSWNKNGGNGVFIYLPNGTVCVLSSSYDKRVSYCTDTHHNFGNVRYYSKVKIILGEGE